ncbi:replicative DNA helicase [Candidatus Nanogingivalis gingivitcus]|jgi:replicative DNA helicase|uniref:Replicative DNA helicase n=1 Tax=Candidatus Nanogingivalis gingivitcus TaxID=2171992 RepID=A0ABY0FL45_9BACT|nr:replicative DNA helicase [Candidatus Nanogingivalis gingivitcus]RYC72880.1 Replicative DNA helicase [Candidatus Nanogingivalis gingivitcus]
MNNSIKQEGKIPPHNIDAEKSLLGAILIDQEVLIDVVEIVKATDFYDKRHGKIFAGMIHLYQNHEGVDLITVTDELKKSGHLDEIGGSTYLAELTNHVPTAAHASSYAEIVSQNAVRRRLIKASADINSLAFDENLTVPQLLGQSEAELFSVSDSSLKQDLTSISDILDTSFDRINDLYVNKGVLRGVKTGYRDLDNMTAGLQRSDLIILAARPAMGKTTLVTNLAYNVATIEKKTVLFFSLEMSKEQLIDRMLADAAGVDSWNIRTGNLSEEDFAKLAEASGEMAEAPIFIDDTPGVSVLEMRTKARRAAHDGELGLIIIDYLQLMQGSGSAQANGNRVQEVSEISRGLKLLARELNVPVIALSQLSRSVENRSPQIPQLADLRESGSIEQDADIVMFIYREAYYNPETERENITDLILAKHRHGPTGTVELYFHPERLRFMSLDKKH